MESITAKITYPPWNLKSLQFPCGLIMVGSLNTKQYIMTDPRFVLKNRPKSGFGSSILLLGDPEATANLYCNFAYPYWEGCVICSIYLR